MGHRYAPNDLQDIAREIRRMVIDTLYQAQSGHPGGSLSAVEILVSLYYHTASICMDRLDDPHRDRILLSKGHACPTLYAILAHRGVIPLAELASLRQLGSRLQGHPDMNKLPGIDMTSGPLGLGLSAGLGMALAARLDQAKYRTFVLLGDGELQEGIVWEAAMAAAKYRLDNLTAIVDLNGVQLDGPTQTIMPLGDVAAKFSSFGWHTLSVDGHSVADVIAALAAAGQHRNQPTVILAQTVKGKGVSFMEHEAAWHGKPLDEEHYQRAITELEAINR